MTEHEDPKMPEVRCGVAGFAHRACVTEWHRWMRCYVCYCPDCRDMQEGTDWEGCGRSQLEAAEYYADNFGGLSELSIKEQHV